jgi:hypothetical protein
MLHRTVHFCTGTGPIRFGTYCTIIDDYRKVCMYLRLVYGTFKGRAPGYFELVYFKRFQVGQTPGFIDGL